MKKISLIIIVVIAFAGSFSCKSRSEAMKSTVIIDTIHTSQSSLDWDGVYSGVLPCEDCPGIHKTVQLNKDGSYYMRVKFLGKEDNEREYSGEFSWNEQGNTITLKEDTQFVSFFVGENTLTQMDADGNKVAPEHVLRKE